MHRPLWVTSAVLSFSYTYAVETDAQCRNTGETRCPAEATRAFDPSQPRSLAFAKIVLWPGWTRRHPQGALNGQYACGEGICDITDDRTQVWNGTTNALWMHLPELDLRDMPPRFNKHIW